MKGHTSYHSERGKLLGCISITLLIVVLFGYSGHVQAQSIKKIVARLQNVDKELKYKSKLESLLLKNSNDILANYCLSYIYSRKKDSDNLFISWILIDKAHLNYFKAKNPNEIVVVNSMLYNGSSKIEKLKNKVDSLLWSYNQAIGLTKLIGNLYLLENSKFFNDYVALRNHLEYGEAVEKNTLEAYDRFLNLYPNALEVADVIIRRDTIEFEEINKTGILFKYNEFIASHPNSKMISKAVSIRDKKSFELIDNTTDLKEWDYFITNYPTAKQIDTALKIRQELAFSIASQINTIESYQDFIQHNPLTSNMQEAIRRRDLLVYNQIQQIADCSAYHIFMSGIPFAEKAMSLFLKEFRQNEMPQVKQ